MDLFASCCGQLAESVALLVANDDTSYSECDESRTPYDPTTLIFQCTPPKRGKSVILDFFSQSWNPSASSVAVSGFGELVHKTLQNRNGAADFSETTVSKKCIDCHR